MANRVEKLRGKPRRVLHYTATEYADLGQTAEKRLAQAGAFANLATMDTEAPAQAGFRKVRCANSFTVDRVGGGRLQNPEPDRRVGSLVGGGFPLRPWRAPALDS